MPYELTIPSQATTLRAGLAPNMPKYRVGRGKMLRGTAHLRLVIPGDSTSFGVGAAAFSQTPYSAAMKGNSYPQRLSEALNRALGASSAFATIANGGQANYNFYDPSVAIGAGWGYTGESTLGGKAWYNTSTTNLWSWTPAGNVTTFELYWLRASSQGTLSWAVDAGGATNVSLSGADGIGKTVISAGSAGAHALNIARVSGGCHIVGAIAYDDTTKKALVINAGQSGAKAADLADSQYAWRALNAIAAYSPDVILYKIGINDWYTTTTDLTAFKASVQATITAYKAIADLVMITPTPTDLAGPNAAANQAAYVQAIRDLADLNGVPLIDINARAVSWANMGTLGYQDSDPHPNGVWYADEAQAIASFLMDA